MAVPPSKKTTSPSSSASGSKSPSLSIPISRTSPGSQTSLECMSIGSTPRYSPPSQSPSPDGLQSLPFNPPGGRFFPSRTTISEASKLFAPSPSHILSGKPTQQHSPPLVPIALPNGNFGCPICPRNKFASFARVNAHIRFFQHIHACPFPQCRWSYDTAKDLRRHSRRHDPRAKSYTCPFTTCGTHKRAHHNSFSRLDLLKRHCDIFHQGRIEPQQIGNG